MLNFKRLKLPELKTRERLLAVGSGFILVVVVLDRLVIGPWLTHQHNVAEAVEKLEGTLQHYSRLLTYKDRVLSQLQPYRKYLRPPLADELQMATFIKEIEELARESQVGLNEVKPLAVESGEFSKQYSLDIEFESTLEEWVDFIVNIESSPSLYEIVRSSLEVQEEVPDRLKGTLRLVSASVQSSREERLEQAVPSQQE